MARSASSRRQQRRWPVAAGVAVGVVVVMAGAFAAHRATRSDVPDLTTVKGAFAAFVAVADKGDYQALYPMLVRDIRDKIDETHANVRRAGEVIERSYPPALKQQALQELGPEAVRRAPDPAHWFGARVGATGKVAANLQEKMSSRLKRIEEKPEGSGHFVVTTVSGATLEFVRGGDGRFSLVPDPADVQQLHYEYLKSIESLNAAMKAARTFEARPAR
ncbi:MAG: hypothetical protein FJ087_23780 [Deltaproteobacteria bacterium]|nr:hypothetical protein [Deltaproteobacteria bacterium]